MILPPLNLHGCPPAPHLCQYLDDQRALVARIERMLQRAALVHHAPQRPDIALVVVRLAGKWHVE